MAFGPIHWLTSFAIFFIVLGIITWSAVHLGKRDSGNSTDIAVRFLDDYFVVERHKSESAIERGSPTSRMTESTDDPTLPANHGGIETSDITEFYKVWQALSSTRDHVGATRNDAAIAVPSAASALLADNDDSTSSEDIPTTTVRLSDKPVASDDSRTTIGEKEIEPQDGVSLVTPPTTTTIHRASSFDGTNNGLRTTDWYRSVGTDDLSWDDGNIMPSVSASSVSSHERPILEEATRLSETTRSLGSRLLNERSEMPNTSAFLSTGAT